MKLHHTDTRRLHIRTIYRDGERTEDTVWGDVRTVSIGLRPGDVEDMLSTGSHRSTPTLFRPEHAQLEWRRHTQWGYNGLSGQGWRGSRDASDAWVLVTSRIGGTNIRADGTLGKQSPTALYVNDDGYGASPTHAPPAWFTEIRDTYDPNVTGSPLDVEPTELVHDSL